jgi:hypothetical protein
MPRILGHDSQSLFEATDSALLGFWSKFGISVVPILAFLGNPTSM